MRHPVPRSRCHDPEARRPPAPPTPEPTERVQGSNHSHEASRYAFPAKDVHNWLVKGKEASNYPTRKIAFLTFDDGPNNGTTPLVLDILKKKKVRATFFYIGERWCWIGGSRGHRADDQEGHAIAIHTFTHNYRGAVSGRNAKPAAILADRERPGRHQEGPR